MSSSLISKVSDAVLDAVQASQTWLLDPVWQLVNRDALRLKIRTDERAQARVVYAALGISLVGKKGLFLGLWIGQSGGAKFRQGVSTELQSRRVRDILIAPVGYLTGFPDAIASVSIIPRFSSASCI